VFGPRETGKPDIWQPQFGCINFELAFLPIGKKQTKIESWSW